MTRRLLALAPLLLAAATAHAAPAPAPDARALVDSVVARYRALPFYRFEGVMHASATGAALPQPQAAEMPFRSAAIRPGRIFNETRSPFLSTTSVADGDSLYLSAPALQQYTAQKAPAPAEAAQLDAVLMQAANLVNGLERARDAGTDTVVTSTGPVRCRRLALEYRPDTSGRVQVLPRMLWVDEARGLVLRDSATTDLSHPQYGAVRQVQVTRWVVADVATPPDPALFRFTPPEGAKRVRRLGPAQPEDERAGLPAKPFSLAVLDGKGKKVSLAAQRGSVVVLDFWATWCGPCRRWMPIVAKLEKETAGRGVKFYAVNLREDVRDVREYVRAQKIAVPVLLDADGAVGTAYGARSIPLTVVIGRDGKIVRTLVGVHPEDDLRDALRDAGVAGL